MKYYSSKIINLISLILVTSAVVAQSGAVYSFTFKVDEELTEYLKVENKSKKWFPGFGVSDAMPQEILDSIKSRAEKNFTSKLNLPVTLCYNKNNKGKQIGGSGGFGFLENLPSNTFNGGKEDCPGNTHYIKLDVSITGDGSSIIIGTKKTKIKPKITIWAKVYDEKKNEIWDKRITIKDFGKLRSETVYYGNTEITNAETLTPFDIYVMYLLGMDMLIDY